MLLSLVARDMRVKVWSLDNDSNQIRDTTLSGHRSRINDVLALDRQRVLSASNDGSVLLWDITKSEQINKIAELGKQQYQLCYFN